MVDVNLSLMGKVEENNQLLTFRNKASFAIRKVLRKKAYTMAIDIVIKSVDYNLYENSKANPSIQFYGYCVLVFQDMTSIEIPIHFPRQRLYYAIQHEAFRQWRGFVSYYEQYLLHRQTGISLGLILGAFDIPPLELAIEVAKSQWIELPLREVYIKCQNNTQFEIEYTAWEPVEFTDPISDEVNNGESNQEDGDKDDGLPEDGIQPRRNPPDNPFADNAPPSSIQELGQKGFDDIDESKLGDTDPSNSPLTGSRLLIGGSAIQDTVDGVVRTRADVFGTSVPPFDVYGCLPDMTISSALMSSTTMSQGIVEVIRFTLSDGTFVDAGFLNSTSDFSIESC